MRNRLMTLGVQMVFVLVGLGAATSVAGSEPGPSLDVQLRGGRLSVDVVDAPLAAVLAEIGRLSGASVTGLEAEEVSATARFADLSLTDALARLLQGRSYLLVHANHAEGGRLRAIKVLGSRAPATRPAIGVPAEVPAFPETTADAVDPVLPEVLQMLAAALAHDDAGLRLLVLEEVATWNVDDPSRASLLARLSGDPDPQVREVALVMIHGGSNPEGRQAALDRMERRPTS